MFQLVQKLPEPAGADVVNKDNHSFMIPATSENVARTSEISNENIETSRSRRRNSVGTMSYKVNNCALFALFFTSTMWPNWNPSLQQEPSLREKVRKGHEFFKKKTLEQADSDAAILVS